MDIITLCQNGDMEAFSSLFEQYKKLVYRTALLMLNDDAEAEDILQEVFIQVYKSIASYKPENGAFSTWLHRITVNCCINWRRHHSKFIPLSCVPSESIPAADCSFEDKIGEDEEIAWALQRLSDKLRAVVVLRFYSELSYAEIAQTLKIPIGTVQSRLNLAIQNLRKDLKDSGKRR
jgi:RNA polymerase sigma-70 factor (ECF subfamily)